MPILSREENQARQDYLRDNPIKEPSSDDEDADDPHADVRFVTKKEQDQRKTEKVSEIEKSFAEYVRQNAELIGNPETYPTVSYSQGTHADTVTFAKDRMHRKDWLTVIWTDHGENEKFVVFTGPDNLTYKLVLRLPQIPGALEAIKQNHKNNIPTFLL